MSTLNKILLIPFVLILFILTSTAVSQDKTKKDIPAGLTKEQILKFKDENGKRIIPLEDLQSDAMHIKIFNGPESLSEYGLSVSSGGDVNDDGYSDIIVGATYNENFSSNTGRVYIYYGGLDMNTVADVVLTGEAVNEEFGYSVSSAGDVNGDGYSDVVVGARYATSTENGRAYVFFGGAVMDNTADVIMTGETQFERFGYSVSSAGDLNSDGYSDVVVGAATYGPPIDIGRAYVFFGGAAMNNTPDLIMQGEAGFENFGTVVSSDGDVNGDGYSDVVVGSPTYSGTFTYSGRTYVFFGGAAMDNTADVIMTGETVNLFLGSSVSCAGDVNGDGYSDVAVGASGYNTYTGRVFVFLGGVAMDNTADVILTGETTSTTFGRSVSSAGDVNGDGYYDVVVGADSSFSFTGRAYVFYGGASMNNVADETMTGEFVNDGFGCSVSSAGDVNGDGYNDIIVGAFGFNSFTGRVYLYLPEFQPICDPGTPHIEILDHPDDPLMHQEGQYIFEQEYGPDFPNDTAYAELHCGMNKYKIVDPCNPWVLNWYVAFFEDEDDMVKVRKPVFNWDTLICQDMRFEVVYPDNFDYTYNTYYDSVVMKVTMIPHPADGCIGDTITHPPQPWHTGNEFICWNWDTVYNYNCWRDCMGELIQFRCIDSCEVPNEAICNMEFDKPLPVELNSFAATVDNENVILNWTTATEKDNAGFEIERRSDAKWYKIGFIGGKGNSYEPVDYTFIDRKLNSGSYSYRLKQIDYNGNFKYYDLIGCVNIGVPDKFSLSQNYPNPFNPITKIDFALPKDEKVMIKIYDLSGREMVTLINEFRTAGYYTIIFNASNLASGIYYYKLTAGNNIAVNKMVVIK